MGSLNKSKYGNVGGMFSNTGAAILGGGYNRPADNQKIMLNIEDILFHEEKLNNILEVSFDFYY